MILGEKSYNEMHEQDEAWQSILAEKEDYAVKIESLQKTQYKQVLFVGCGSSYYISLAGSHIFNKITGIRSKAVPASEIIFYPERYLDSRGDNLVVFVSRSGKTTEVIKALKEVSSFSNTTTIGFTCYQESKLAKLADKIFVSDKGREESVVMTKSFSSMLFAIEQFSAIWGEDESFLQELKQLPTVFKEKVEDINQIVKDFVEEKEYNKYEFLGHGSLYGIANEAMLKMKEMAIVPSEDFHSLEFRHGPKSIVDDSMLITFFADDESYESETKLCKEMIDYGADIIFICNNIDHNLTADNGLIIDYNTDLSSMALTPLYLLPGQFLGYYTAVKQGIDVDNPKNLTQVVENI